MNEAASQALEPCFDVLREVEEESGINASVCYQCRKCTNGCPLTFAMDYYPDRIVRFLLLGQEERALGSATIWVCSSCETCTTRCPNDIDIAGLMDYLKQKAAKAGKMDPRSNPSYALHRVFLRDIGRRGRIYEAGMLNEYMLASGVWKDKLRQGALWDDMKLGWSLFRKGRLPLRPRGIPGKEEIQELFSLSASR